MYRCTVTAVELKFLTLAQLYINKEMPHPSTSPAYCPDPPLCISSGDEDTASSICVNPGCLGLGAELRAEPERCHGNLWTRFQTLPKTSARTHTNIPFSFSFLFFVVLLSGSCFPNIISGPHQTGFQVLSKLSVFFFFVYKNNVKP